MQLIVDFGEIEAGMNTMYNIGKAITSKTFINRTAEHMSKAARDQFYHEIDAVAAASPNRFHHLYEWGELGQPAGRLFNLLFEQHGSSGRLVNHWLPSRIPVPVQGDQSRHVFVWKAPVMENQAVSGPIQAGDPYRRVSVSSYGPAREWLRWYSGSTEVFTKGPIRVSYQATNNAYTIFWEQFWARQRKPAELEAESVETIRREGTTELNKRIAMAKHKSTPVQTQKGTAGPFIDLRTQGRPLRQFKPDKPNPGLIRQISNKILRGFRRQR